MQPAREVQTATSAMIEAIVEGEPPERNKVEHAGDGVHLGFGDGDLSARAVPDVIDPEGARKDRTVSFAIHAIRLPAPRQGPSLEISPRQRGAPRSFAPQPGAPPLLDSARGARL